MLNSSTTKQTGAATTTLKPRKHLNLNFIHAALSENSDGVENMKREVLVLQEGELAGAQRELIKLRKDHDRLSSNNESLNNQGRIKVEVNKSLINV